LSVFPLFHTEITHLLFLDRNCLFSFISNLRGRFGLTVEAVYSLTIYLAVGVLVGGRLVEVLFYEWPYYREHLWQIGQAFNIFMSVLGAFLLFWFTRKQHAAKADSLSQTALVSEPPADWRPLWLGRIVFGSLLLFPLTLPSDWTQDIPARYGKRHAGMHYSFLYPHIEGNIPTRSK